MHGFAFCNELYGDLPLDDALNRIAHTGYSGVEFDARCLVNRDMLELADKCQERGLAVAGLHWLLAGTRDLHLTHPSREVRRATLGHLRNLAVKCAELGGRVMTLGAGQTRSVLPGVTRDEALSYAEEVLTALGHDLVAKGVYLGVEPLRPQECNLLNRADVAAELVDRIGCPNIGLTLDAKAMSSESRPREELVAAYARYLVHVHVNDPSGTGPGMGPANLGPMLRAVKNVAYEGWISVEAFDPAPDPDTVAIQSIEYIRQLWQNA